MENRNIDWEEVERKISIICYRFNNLAPWYEDLAQELRIHAYYVSDNYFDLYRKTIDFWRKVQTKQSPEVPYFDLEILNSSYDEDTTSQFPDMVSLIRKELSIPGQSKWEDKKTDVARILLDVILEDIDPKRVETSRNFNSSSANHYINQRLNLTWISEETGVSYKRVVDAMKLLEDIVRGLAAMHKIEIPDEYFNGYYD